MKHAYLILSALLLSTLARAQQPSLLWSTEFTFGGNADQPVGLEIYHDGSIVVNGHYHYIDTDTSYLNAALSRFDAAGNQIWTVRDSISENTTSWWNHATVLNQDHIVWYSSNSFSSGGRLALYTLNGELVWRKEQAHLLHLTSYEDTLIAITASTSGDSSVAFLIDMSGTVVRSFPLTDVVIGLTTPTVHGRYLWLSAIYYSNGGTSNKAAFVAKYDIITGEQLWRWNVEDGIRGTSVVDKDGNAYFGLTRLTTSTEGLNQFMLVKFDPNGNILWQNEWFGRNSYETNYENWVNGITLSDTHEQVVLIGSTQRGSSHIADKFAYATGFHTNTGNSLWVMRHIYDPNATISHFTNGEFDNDGSLILLGKTFSGENVPNVGYLQKYQLSSLAVEIEPSVPTQFSLSQNYPNPFNPSTTIAFELSERTLTTLIVYNVLGQQVAELVNGVKMPGWYEAVFNGQNFPSGTYFYRLTTGTSIETKKMVLLK